ncbi:MAG: hypothetical protein PF961_13955 [Planctomycetota bacterium]|jgi:hypothetical protein|nr:hypothetical protein [Planctomycetota bacterium]
MSEECGYCEGFGYVPEGSKPRWYSTDWRLLLDPTVRWEACPECSSERSPLSRLHEHLAEMLMQRINAQVEEWTQNGAWEYGNTDEGQAVWRWGSVALLPPGPDTEFQGWLLVSPLGVARSDAREDLTEMLSELGAPRLP